MSKPKILLIDIETAPIVGYVWGLWQQNLGLEQILEDWTILSFSAKWVGEDEVFYFDTSKQKNLRDDRKICKEMWKLLDKADQVCAHNGRKFDVKKINWRFLKNGMSPPSPFKIVDTLECMKRHFGATSNKLAWATAELNKYVKKRDHGKFPGFKLWAECLKRNPEAWEEMKSYNIDDTRSLEEVYLMLRPWWSSHPNMGAYGARDGMMCSKCGSHDLQRRGFDFTVIGKYQRYKCKTCGGWSRGRQSVILKEDRADMLVSSTRT